MSGTLENPMLTLFTAPAPSPTPTGPTSIPLTPTPAPGVNAQLTPTDPNDIFAAGQSVDLSAIVSELANSSVAGDTLTLDSISFATGSTNLVNGDIVYTTPSSGSGAIDYTVSDQYGATTTGTLDFTIDPGPTTKPGSITIGHGQAVNLAGYVENLVTPGLSGDTVQLLSASTANGQTSLADTKAGTVLDYTAPAGGTDTLTYTVADEFVSSTGTVVSGNQFTYTQTTGTSAPVSGTVAITIDPGPTATDPTLVVKPAGSLDLSRIVGQLATPGLSGDTLKLTRVSAADGTVFPTKNGDFIYRGVNAQGGIVSATDTISYTVTDQFGDTVQGTARITTDPGPTLAAGSYTIGDGQSANLTSYLDSLITPGAPGDQETITGVSAQSGQASLSSFSFGTGAPGQTAVGYTAPASGSDTLTYTVTDENGVKATGTVAITVDPGPATQPGTLTVGHDQTTNLAGYVESLVTPGLAGDTVQLLSASVANGQASLADTKAGTVLDYTAPAGGTDTLSYTVEDRFLSSVSTIVSGNQISYAPTYATSAPVSGTVAITVDPGPTTTAASASLQLGQSLDLTNTILAADKPGLAGDTLTLVADNTNATLGNVSLANGDLTYSATGPALAGLAANGSVTDSFSYVVSDQYGDSAVGTVDVTVTNPLDVINGGPYGGSTIEGTPGNDQINAYGYNNTIYDNGGNDIVDAGQGQATVYAAGGNVTVNLSGYNNLVSGGDGADSISGSQGNTSVALGAGADLVQLGGYDNTVTLGNGNDKITAGSGNEIVTVGNGNDTITLGGYGNRIAVGNGNDTIVAGAGNATITGGGGTDTVTLQGNGNTVSFTGGNDTISGGAGSDVFNLTGGNANLVLQGSNEMVFLNGANATIDDQGSGLAIKVAGGGNDVLQNFAADPQAFVDLVGGIGGYGSASQVLAALTPDGHGGSMLSLGTAGSIDFAGVGVSQLHASNFHIG